ncbi:hypothetical protein TWF694_007752 [Orbilia ellipsospora]|uniref:FAD-binding FR-type domain-containing protein n=1 Tax=Orbilia ellipsospora TaxID=2528407 RepID=A0AAV9XL94_9PEZI
MPPPCCHSNPISDPTSSLPFPLSVAWQNTETFDMWWPSSIFNTQPVLGSRVSDFVKRSAENGEQAAIIDALRFSRKLGIYYNVACFVFPIAVFVVRKTVASIKRQQRRRSKNKARSREDFKANEIEAPEVDSPSISTSSSSASSANNVVFDEPGIDESTSLLSKDSCFKIPWYILFYRRIQGYLGYQRPNDSRGRVMPTNGISIINAILSFGTIFLAIYRIFWPGFPTNNPNLRWFLCADRWGIIFAMNQPLNYLLAAKTSPIKFLTGWSYEQHLVFHMGVSAVSLYCGIFHFGGMYIVYRKFIAHTGQTFLSILARPEILMGLMSFTSFWIFGILSTDGFRAKSYELFLATHIIFAALANVFLYFHHPTARIYVVLSMAIWIVDRLIYRAYRKRWTAEASVTVLDESTVRVVIRDVGGSKRNSGSKELEKWKWEPASHVFLTVPGWSKIQAHPFTILSAPTGHDLDFLQAGRNGEEKEKEMVLVIRKLQGFTAGLFEMGNSQAKVKVVVDGPYGSDHARDTLKGCKKCVFIAGGSGIAVVWPLLSEMIRREVDKAKAGKKVRRRKIVLIWLVQYIQNLRWIHQELEELEAVRPVLPRELEVEVRKYVTRGSNGFRPDLGAEITNIVRGEDGETMRGKTGVVVCGPDGMVREVRSTGYDLLWKGDDVEIMAEKFGW